MRAGPYIKSRVGLWLKKVPLICILLLFLYALTAPFILPIAYFSKVGKFVYKPVILAIRKDWFGRDVVFWYCYDVCHMDLLIPIEPNKDENANRNQ